SPIWTRLHTCWRFTDRESVLAHVTFAYDAQALVVLRYLVGTRERAVLTADALVIEVLDDPRALILLVGTYRAAVHAGGIEAVVAGGCNGLLDRGLRRAAVNDAYRTPCFVMVQTV